MGKILSAYISPHPPIVVKEIGKGEEKKAQNTVEGLKKIAQDVRLKKPTTIILVTPHGPLFSDAISISCEKDLEGSFQNFGRKDLKFHFKNNTKLTDETIKEATRENILIAPIDKYFSKNYGVNLEVDHGALVPLYFINKEYTDYRLVHITYGLLSPTDLYKFGMILQKIVLESDEEVVFIASGDLSHRLSNESPYGYVAEGKIFDEKIVNLLKNNDFSSIVSFDLNLSESAGECGLRSFMIMTGFLDGFNVKSEIYSYEGPFGVGYCTGKIEILGRDKSRAFYEKLKKDEKGKIANIREKEDEYVRLARNSLEYYVRNGEILEVPKNLSKNLIDERAGVFVSIKKDGKLRGCIGTIEATQNTVAEEIIKNAVSAGTRDPRFESIEEEEFESLVYSVDVLKKPERISSIKELDVKKYGVIVSKGFRRGLLLPNLEGVNTPSEQVEISLQKAGIGKNEEYTMERFEVERHC